MADAPHPETGQGQSARTSRPGGGRVSLGGALFDGLPADGHFIPADPVPGSWLDLYTEHADEDGTVHVGVYRSCHGGRDFTLREAGKARLTLHSKGAKDVADWEQQLVGIRAALRTRGSKPTSVGLTVHNKDYLAAVSEQLQGAGQGITELRVKDEQMDSVRYYDSAAAEIDQRMTQFLSTLHLLCPNITTLDLHTLPCLLPPPSHLPRLAKVALQSPYGRDAQAAAEQVCSSIGPYLAQLTTLTYDGCALRMPVESAFTATTTTHTLTHLTFCGALNQTTTGLLVKYAPALTHLDVSSVGLASTQHRGVEWSVVELRLQQWCDVQRLARLPSTRGGSLTIYTQYGLEICGDTMSDLGLHQDIVERMPSWHFPDAETICLEASEIDQPAALRNTLRQLTDLQSPCHQLTLIDWQWTEDLGIAASEATAALARFKLSILDDGGGTIMTDDVLRGLLRLGTHVAKVDIDSVDLQVGCSDAVWPLESLSLCSLDLGQVLKLPDPSIATGPVSLETHYVDIKPMLQEDVEPLRQRLQHVRLSLHDIRLHHPENHQYESLRDQLSCLPALGTEKNGSWLTLVEWPMTADALSALRHLPPWSCTLDLSNCTWPEDPDVYGGLGMCAPVTYKRWVLGKGVKPKTALLTSICAGINERRQGLECEPVTVVLFGTGCGGAVVKVGEHVLLEQN